MVSPSLRKQNSEKLGVGLRRLATTRHGLRRKLLWVGLALQALATDSLPASDAHPVFDLKHSSQALQEQPAQWTTQPGPWGTITVKSTYLEAPPALIELAPKPDQIPIWRFPGWTLAAIRDLLAKAGLSAAEQAVLLDSSNVRHEILGPVLLPPPALLIELAPAARQIIYEELAKLPPNSFHATPLPLPGNVDDWLLESKLSPTQRILFKQLLWTRGSCHVFSDLSLLINQATSASEIAAAISSQTRVQSLVASIRVPSLEQAESVLEYWRANRANSHVMPFFRSAIGREGVSEIDLIYLLPRLARARLFTYPTLTDAIGGKMPDCHWTAVNFFAINYQPYYLDGRSGFIDLLGTYNSIPEPTQLGDLICFIRKDGTVAHSCVLVADDIVFTKNGVQVFSPWVLLRFSAVAAIYNHDGVNQLAFFRSKTRPTSDL